MKTSEAIKELFKDMGVIGFCALGMILCIFNFNSWRELFSGTLSQKLSVAGYFTFIVTMISYSIDNILKSRRNQ